MKTTEQAYADTLPPLVKDAVEAHEVLVGMNHRMVLAALGEPESKIREQQSGDANGARYEEWIYGHEPQTIHFVRFVGDRVTVVEIAALGKPLEIHDKDEMGGYNPPAPTREIAMGDQQPGNSAKTDRRRRLRCASRERPRRPEAPAKCSFQRPTSRFRQYLSPLSDHLQVRRIPPTGSASPLEASVV